MDNQTLIVALTLVSIISSVSLVLNWAGNRNIPGLMRIAVGLSLSSLGILFLATRPISDPVISVLLANALILGGRIPVMMGLAHFWNQENSKLPLLSIIVFIATLLGVYYFTFINENTVYRTYVYTSMMVLTSACNVFLIGNGLKIERKLRPIMALTTNYGAYLAVTLFSFNVVVEAALLLFRTGAPFSEPDQGTSLFLLGSIITILVFSFSVIIMTMEELAVEFKENAIYDPITTILNHRTFLEVGQRVLGVALRYSKPVSLLTIEVENMEEMIKIHGQKTGNEILRHFSIMASDRRRNEDVLARSSFNEFRMLLPGVDEEGAQIVVEKIRKALVTEAYSYQGKTIELRANIAAVTHREEDLHLQQMLQEGEIELFRSKQNIE